MKRVTYLYGWKASSEIVDDWIFDEIANKFFLDEKMKVFFQENNPYALEEISRRLLEANTRGLWNCNKKLLNNLKHSYIKTEPWLEEKIANGEFQGGLVDVVGFDDVVGWGNKINKVIDKINKKIKDKQ